MPCTTDYCRHHPVGSTSTSAFTAFSAFSACSATCGLRAAEDDGDIVDETGCSLDRRLAANLQR
jgi:hypothetical protein